MKKRTQNNVIIIGGFYLAYILYQAKLDMQAISDSQALIFKVLEDHQKVLQMFSDGQGISVPPILKKSAKALKKP